MPFDVLPPLSESFRVAALSCVHAGGAADGVAAAVALEHLRLALLGRQLPGSSAPDVPGATAEAAAAAAAAAAAGGAAGMGLPGLVIDGTALSLALQVCSCQAAV